MALHPSTKAEMQKPYFLSAFLFQINHPMKTLRLLDGSGEVHWGVNIFQGSDPDFGVIAAMDPLTETVGTEAPSVRMKMLPQNNFSMAAMTDPAIQGSEVFVWWAVINPDTGRVVGEPLLVFLGQIDTGEVDYDQNETTMQFDIGSVWDYLFMDGEGLRLNNAQHQRTWSESASSEQGFKYIVAIQRQENWGASGPRPPLVADVIGGQPAAVGGGSGGGGGGSLGGGSAGGGIRADYV